jgi:DNA-binding NtrC family response regulator
MTRRASILVIEDDPEMRSLLVDELQAARYEVIPAPDGRRALELFAERDVDVVVTDHMMPGIKGRELLTRFRTRKPDVPVILITAFGTIDAAVDAMKGGAYHYVPKPFAMDQLLVTVASALRERSLLREVARLRDELDDVRPEIVARAPAMKECLALVRKAADSDMPVLLLGESGTGKELLARMLHARGGRRDAPFLAVNCAAIPESLLESELFGHRRGAFTDAREDRRGLLQEADGGTLLLDEIGDMPLPLQAKILRVLQEGEVHPVGASAPVKVDVRIVAATHRNLTELVAERRFREDLFYRIDVIAVRIPPLRERPEDLLPLVAHMLEKHGARLRRPDVKIAPEALDRLRSHSWPGNVRELENAVQRALALSESDVISVEDLPEQLREPVDPESARGAGTPGVSLANVTRDHVLRVLQSVRGNKAAAARLLGVDRKTLYRKLEAYGIPTEPDPSDPPASGV